MRCGCEQFCIVVKMAGLAVQQQDSVAVLTGALPTAKPVNKTGTHSHTR